MAETSRKLQQRPAVQPQNCSFPNIRSNRSYRCIRFCSLRAGFQEFRLYRLSGLLGLFGPRVLCRFPHFLRFKVNFPMQNGIAVSSLAFLAPHSCGPLFRPETRRTNGTRVCEREEKTTEHTEDTERRGSLCQRRLLHMDTSSPERSEPNSQRGTLNGRTVMFRGRPSLRQRRCDSPIKNGRTRPGPHELVSWVKQSRS